MTYVFLRGIRFTIWGVVFKICAVFTDVNNSKGTVVVVLEFVDKFINDDVVVCDEDDDAAAAATIVDDVLLDTTCNGVVSVCWLDIWGMFIIMF